MREDANSIAISKATLDCAKLISKLNVFSRMAVIEALSIQTKLDLAIIKEIEKQKAAPRPVVMPELPGGRNEILDDLPFVEKTDQ